MIIVTLKQGYNEVVAEFKHQMDAISFANTCLNVGNITVLMEKVVEEDVAVQNTESE